MRVRDSVFTNGPATRRPTAGQGRGPQTLLGAAGFGGASRHRLTLNLVHVDIYFAGVASPRMGYTTFCHRRPVYSLTAYYVFTYCCTWRLIRRRGRGLV